jgi:hypothetical protein
MTTSMHRIINVETNEITDVEFTAEELKAYEAAELAEQEKADARAAAKAALLERLGMTAEEASLLFS